MIRFLHHERILCGTEEFWVPAVLAAVSAGGQAINQSNANSRAQNAEVQNIEQQQQLRQQANDQVKNLTQQIKTNDPQQIASQEQTAFVNNLRNNEAGTAAGGASNTEAGEMSAVDAAVRQRQNEGLAMQTLGTNLNLLGAQSGATGFVNQLRAQAAGQTSPWASLFSNILGGAASGMSKNGWFAGSPPAGNGLALTQSQGYGG